MRATLFTMMRIVGWLFLLLAAAAVTLSRLVPEPALAHSSVEARLAKPGWIGCSASPQGRPSGKTLLIDPEEEKILTVRLPRGESLDQATGSPWINDSGRGEVVGRWVRVQRDLWTGAKRIEDGLARFSIPDGHPLDRIATHLLPFSPPSWSPDRRGLVIYPSGDGRLYRVVFPPRTADSGSQPTQPTALRWSCDRPGGGSVRILDASWLEEPALGGLVLASIVAQETIDGKVRNQAAQLWWLRLDSEAQAIVEAGPLTGHRMDSSERFPRLLRDPSTGLLLAYLIITESADSAYLAVAPLRIGPGSSGPMLIENESRILARECAVDAPVPSSDGRSIAVVCRDREGRAEPPRLVAIGTPGSR